MSWTDCHDAVALKSGQTWSLSQLEFARHFSSNLAWRFGTLMGGQPSSFNNSMQNLFSRACDSHSRNCIPDDGNFMQPCKQLQPLVSNLLTLQWHIILDCHASEFITSVICAYGKSLVMLYRSLTGRSCSMRRADASRRNA